MKPNALLFFCLVHRIIFSPAFLLQKALCFDPAVAQRENFSVVVTVLLLEQQQRHQPRVWSVTT
jgi:hypothetical protein